MKDYKNPIYATMKMARANLSRIADNIYQQGYEAGKAATPFTDTEEAEDKAYNRGLNDAWEVIKKITKDDSVGGYSIEMMQELFGQTCVYDITHNYTPEEAIAKIREYENKEKQDAEIKVGDEVITKYKDHAVAVRDTYYLGADKEPFTLIWFGTHMSSCPVNELTKTGRTFPQIAEVLAEMRGAE